VKIRAKFYCPSKHGSQAASDEYRLVIRDARAELTIEPPPRHGGFDVPRDVALVDLSEAMDTLQLKSK
jgi:hypothetical protein